MLYGELDRIEPSPVVAVNRAVAVARANGPASGMVTLDRLADDPRVADYQPFRAAPAELLTNTGDLTAADASYQRAIELAGNEAERTARLERATARTE